MSGVTQLVGSYIYSLKIISSSLINFTVIKDLYDR
jgi:hypothetical protein